MPELDDSLWTATVGVEQILYTELVRDGSPTFNVENDATTLTRQILVLWDSLNTAKKAFLGYSTVQGQGGAQQWVSRNVPDASALFSNGSGGPYLYATKLSGQGYGMPPDAATDGIHDPATDSPVYRYAKLEVMYETLTYDVLSDDQMVDNGWYFIDQNGNKQPDESTLARYVTFELHPGSEYLTLPQGGFRFVGPTIPGVDGGPPAPSPVQGGPGKIVSNYDCSLTWHLVPRDCVGSLLINPGLKNPPIDQCLGCVNSLSFPNQENGAMLSVQYAVPATAGTGYKVGDVLALTTGTPNPATLRVTAVGAGGGILTVVPLAPGLDSPALIPVNPVVPITGRGSGSSTAGSGATFNVTWGGGRWPVGAMLMTGAEIKPIRSTSGDRLYDLIYRFKFLSQGIQFLYYQGTSANNYADAGYFEVSTTGKTNYGAFNNTPAPGTSLNIYPWADFNNLFRVPS